VDQPRGHILLFNILINCHFSSRRKLGDEYHYIFECSKFTNGRKLYIDFVRRNRPNVIKYNNLMSSNSIYTLSKLCKLIRITNINKANNRLSPQLMEHKNDLDI
jgi:hypothetical protein